HLIAWDVPAIPGYLEYKRAIFTSIVPGWEDLMVEGDIDWRLVSWGGVLIDSRPHDATERPQGQRLRPPLQRNGRSIGDGWLRHEGLSVEPFRLRELHFYLLPFMHSETHEDVALSVTLCEALNEKSHEFAVRHLEIIARFGRYPHRNTVLGRTSTAEELEFLQQPNSSF
ncbi:MAG: DUF924 family protein, partial [Pseudomonadota bacterium]